MGEASKNAHAASQSVSAGQGPSSALDDEAGARVNGGILRGQAEFAAHDELRASRASIMADDEDSAHTGEARALNPMAIARIDIVDQDDGGAAIIIWSRDRNARMFMTFDTREAAIQYVREIWEARQARSLADNGGD